MLIFKKNENIDKANFLPGPLLIVGLGNPGREYKHNRHNFGFILMDWLAARFNLSFSHVEFKALITKCTYQNHRVILAKPQTFMNESGRAVSILLRYYKVSLQNLLVAYDDVDLPFETIRLRADGGSGGHKGMKSIIERLGSDEFARLRLGIGRPPGRKEAADYVLHDFSKEEMLILPNILNRAMDASLVFLVEGITQAMNQFNGPESEQLDS